MILSKGNAAASFQGSALRVIHCKELHNHIHTHSLYVYIYIYMYIRAVTHLCSPAPDHPPLFCFSSTHTAGRQRSHGTPSVPPFPPHPTRGSQRGAIPAPLDAGRARLGNRLGGASPGRRAAQAEPRGERSRPTRRRPPPPQPPHRPRRRLSGLDPDPEGGPAPPSPAGRRRRASPAKAAGDGPSAGPGRKKRLEARGTPPRAPAHLSAAEHGGGRAVPPPPPPPPPSTAQTGRVPAWLPAGPAAAPFFRRCHDPSSAPRHSPAAAPRRHLERGPP